LADTFSYILIGSERKPCDSHGTGTHMKSARSIIFFHLLYKDVHEQYVTGWYQWQNISDSKKYIHFHQDEVCKTISDDILVKSKRNIQPFWPRKNIE
jgi:hypothetical protein